MSSTRRSFLLGLGSTLAAPAVVSAASLMPVKMFGPRVVWLADGFIAANGAELSRSEFPELFAVYGEMFGKGDGKATFETPRIDMVALQTTAVDRGPLDVVGGGSIVGATITYPQQVADRRRTDFVVWNGRARTMMLRAKVADFFSPRPSILNDPVFERAMSREWDPHDPPACFVPAKGCLEREPQPQFRDSAGERASQDRKRFAMIADAHGETYVRNHPGAYRASA